MKLNYHISERASLSSILSSIALVFVMLLASFPLSAQNKITVSGSVSDENDEPLVGAVVAVVGSDNKSYIDNTTTDINGSYSIKCLPDAQIRVIFLGYENQQTKVKGRSTVNFVLSPDAAMALQESVVIGYGSVKKADLTGSVTNVRMADIKDIPVATVDQALQGRIAGADIMSTTGEPGSTTSIRIRGTRSISASNEPLFVVDGVMDGIHDLNDINSSDIESITVLKDASSTAIYGSRGSNGVIIVTTKAGTQTNGKPTVTLKSSTGFSQLPSGLDIMNATEFALYRNEYATYTNANGWEDIGVNSPVSESVYGDPFKYGEGTNWINEITRTALYLNENLSISGGNKKTQYYFSAGWSKEEGIIKKSGMNKFNTRLSIDHQLFKWLKVGYKMTYTYRRNDQNLTSIGGRSWWSAAQYLSPLIKPEDNYNPLYYAGQKINTPTALLDNNIDFLKRNSTTHTAYGEIKLLPELKIRSQLSYYLYQRSQFRYYPSTLPRKVEGEGGEAYRSDWNEYSLNSETTITYDKTWNKTHHFDAMAGFTGYHYRGNDLSVSGSGYLVDGNKWNNMGAVQDKETYSVSTSTTSNSKMSYLARVNYNYKSRYYLTLTGRMDGASNFAAHNKWGFFPSGALKWNMANEPFMKPYKWIDELSVRLSAGRSGNDAISQFRSLAAMSSTTNGYLFGGSQPVAYYPSRLSSPDLTWEKTDTYNAALTGSFLNNRINFTAEFYISKTKDLLLTVKTATQTGYSSRFANIGATTNKGIEFNIDTRNIVKNNFSWLTSFTIAHNKQRVDNIGAEEFVSAYNSPGNNPFMMYGYVKDYPLNALWGFKNAGVWHNQEEITRNAATHTYVSSSPAYSKTLGAPKFLDVNHDGSLNQDDLCYLGNADPYVYGGLQNTFYVGNFNFGVYFMYSLGGKIYNYSEFYMSGSQFANQYRYMLDSWNAIRNPDSDYPRAGILDAAMPSDFMVHDASFLRLKNVSLGYTLTMKHKKVIRDITFSVSGENLYLWKKYNGFDPDVSSSGTSSTLRRLDLGAYPKPRTIIFTLQIRY